METYHMKLNKVDEQVIAALKLKDQTLAELAEQTNLPSKKVFRSLRKLFENEMIDSQGRKYRLLKDKPPVKGKDEEEVPDET
jgi:predicted transcriptional regulator